MHFMAKNLKKLKSFRFSDDEMELLDALKAKYGSYNKGIVTAARRELSKNGLSKAAVIAWIEAIDDQ